MHEDKIKILDVENAVLQFFQINEVKHPLNHLISILPENSDLLIAGGALRNVIIQQIHGWSPPTRDIDIFIGVGQNELRLDLLFEEHQVQKTDLEGVRWIPQNSSFSFDMCLLKDFVIIQKYNLPPTRESLLTDLDFNVNAVIFDFKHKKLIQNNCIQGIEKQVLDFNSNRIYNKLLLAYRILLIRHKIKFMLSRRTFHFIKSSVDVDMLVELRDLLFSKQNKETAQRILKDFDRISRCRDYETYCSIYSNQNSD